MNKKLVTSFLVALIFLFIRPLGASAQGVECQADITQDGVIDLSDYSIVALNFLSTTPTNPRADINADGVVDLTDYSQIATRFLTSPQNCNPTTPSPVPIVNLLQNGDFETGNMNNWQTGAGMAVQTQDVHQGTYAVHQTAPQSATQGWINVTPGQTYTVTGWFKWVAMSNNDWGYSRLIVQDNTWTDIAGENNIDQTYAQGLWHQIAFSFVPTTNQVQVIFGTYGPETTVDLYFDDIKLFVKTGNADPTANPQASVTSGTAPLSVNFTANASDPDGAISVYKWQFGDGSESRLADPSHTYIAAGTYTANLIAYDNEGASVTKGINITVSDPNAPSLSITSPTSSNTFSTSATSVTLSGNASDSNTITSVVWDNINTDAVGTASYTSPSWTTSSINLKPGKNEILITATNSVGKIKTSTLTVNRQVSGPQISNISVNTTTPGVYSKYEATFNLDTVADKPMFVYDPNPPNGADYSGVTVEGLITLPGGQTVTQPAFYNTNVTKSGSKYVTTNVNNWKLRYSPQQQGIHQVSLKVTDASGTQTVPVGSFTAGTASNKGFVKVASADSRYFEYSNGQMFWPVGMTWNGASGTTPDGINLANSVLNYDRPWMGGSGAYSTNWARWKSSAENLGNEGITSRFSFLEHYPSSELSQYINYPTGYRMWISCWLDDAYCANIQSGRTYQIKLRLKTLNVTGPRNAGNPYGLMIKRHAWLGNQTPDQLDQTLTSSPALIPHINGTTDWHTVVATFTANSGDSDFSVYLANATGGEVFIDEFSVREVLGGGALGGEQIRNSLADMHTYVEQRPMKGFDDQVDAGVANDVHLRFVVHDKNDWIQNHLSAASGAFVQSGDGYYQDENTKATWLQKQWWRYLVARLGYSPGVFGWELNNEGSPDDTNHYRHTQLFSKWMHDLDAHPHLANTSFWCCWKPLFWGDNTTYPDVDYADIHHYGSPTDMLDWYLAEAVPAYSDNVGKPIVRGETGIISGTNTNNYEPALATTNPGIWYNNMLWSQLHYTAMYEIGYWFPQHATGFSRDTMARSFLNFIADADFNKGGYTELLPENAVSYRFIGQKNLSTNKAYMWLRHPNFNWKNGPVTVGSTFTIQLKMNPNTTYYVHPYDITNGQFGLYTTVTSNSTGVFSFSAVNIGQQFAYKVSTSTTP